MGDSLLGAVILKIITICSPHFWTIFYWLMVSRLILTKHVLGNIWCDFSQTHLVTLLGSEPRRHLHFAHLNFGLVNVCGKACFFADFRFQSNNDAQFV
jgi:hypothetical protein